MGIKIQARFENWPERMADFIAAHRTRPFDWDGWNCCLWSFALVDAITGSGLYERYRPFGTSKEAGMAYIKEIGGIEAEVTRIFGPPLSTPRKAQRGDLILFTILNDIPALGILALNGRDILALHETLGLIEIPLARAVAAWRV